MIARGLGGYDNLATGFDLAFFGYCHRAILIHDIRVALLGAVAKAARLLDIVFVVLSILKSDGGNPDNTIRITFSYDNPQNGKGHFIHTYMGDGNPLPSFEGEPEPVEIKGTIDEFAGNIWNSLNGDNKVSLFVRFIDIKSGEYKEIIFNKNR